MRGVLALSLVVLLGALPGPATAEPVVTRTLQQLGTDGLSAQGLIADAQTFIAVPPGYAVHGGTVELRFSHSPLLLADRSTLTLSAGGQALTSTRLTQDNRDRGTLRATLPALPASGFVLDARFTMRLTRDSCEDPRNQALWAQVDGRSRVTLDLRPAGRTVTDALDLLAPPAPGEAIDIALPHTGPAELAAAGLAVGALGRADAGANADPLVRLTTAPGDRPALVVRAGSSELDAGQGLIEVARDGPPQVLVAGRDDRGLQRAARALTARSLAPPGRSRRLVTTTPVTAPGAALPWRDGAASFAQLGLDDRTVSGPGVTTIDLQVDRPPQWSLTGTSRLNLVVDAGAGLQAGTSSVAVRLGGSPAGSRRLRPGAGPQTLAFTVPAGLIDRSLDGRATRRLPISLRFDQDVDQRGCRPLDVDAAHTVVGRSSSIVLPHDEETGRDLSRFPAPVVRPGSRAAIVLPDSATPGQVAAGLQLAAAIGRWADPRAPLPELLRARDVRPRLSDLALVLVGDAARQLGRGFGAPLDVPLAAGAAMVGLARSPWNADRDVLVVRGDDAGLQLAARTLAGAEGVEGLAGTVMTIRPGADSNVTAVDAPRPQPPAVLAPVIPDEDESLWEEIPPWAIPAGVVLLMLLALGTVVVRRRWLGGRR